MRPVTGIVQENENTSSGNAAPASTWRRLLAPAAILALLAGAWAGGLFDLFSLSSLIMHRETLDAFVSSNLLVGLLAYVAIYAGLVAVSFPGASLLTIISGFLFGGFLGGFVTVFAATLGAAIIFEVARTSLGKSLEAGAGRFMARMRKGFAEDGFFYLLTLRLTPVFPFWVINIVPAFLGMRLWPYVVATFIGIIPGTLAYSYIGAGLDSVIMAQEQANPGCAAAGTCSIEPSALVTTEVIIAMAGLGIVSLLPVIVRRVKRARKES